MKPDRVVIGASDAETVAVMKEIYAPLHSLEIPFVVTNVESSELIKYAANGFLVFVTGTMTAWLPSYFNRVYGLPLQAASIRAAAAILAAGIGASLCGFIVDRFARKSRRALFVGPAVIATSVAVLLGAAFQLPPGPLQYALIMAGSIGLAGTQGPMCSAIASLVHPGLRATSLATLAVVQNIVGLAAGSLITGILSDHFGIARALGVVPVFALVSAAFFLIGAKRYEQELAQAPQQVEAAPQLDATPQVSLVAQAAE